MRHHIIVSVLFTCALAAPLVSAEDPEVRTSEPLALEPPGPEAPELRPSDIEALGRHFSEKLTALVEQRTNALVAEALASQLSRLEVPRRAFASPPAGLGPQARRVAHEGAARPPTPTPEARRYLPPSHLRCQTRGAELECTVVPGRLEHRRASDTTAQLSQTKP